MSNDYVPAQKRSEAAVTKYERRYLCGGSKAHQRAVRDFNRARRRGEKAALRRWMEAA